MEEINNNRRRRRLPEAVHTRRRHSILHKYQLIIEWSMVSFFFAALFSYLYRVWVILYACHLIWFPYKIKQKKAEQQTCYDCYVLYFASFAIVRQRFALFPLIFCRLDLVATWIPKYIHTITVANWFDSTVVFRNFICWWGRTLVCTLHTVHTLSVISFQY